MLDFFTSLNEHNLPYPDPLHPIVVHFVIAMVLFSVFCDIAGYLTGKNTLFEVSWWNMCIATVAKLGVMFCGVVTRKNSLFIIYLWQFY